MNNLPKHGQAPHPLSGLGPEKFLGASLTRNEGEDGLEHLIFDFPNVGYIDCSKGSPHFDDTILGAMEEDVFFIHDVAVVEELRGNEFAVELAQWAIKTAKEEGFDIGEAAVIHPSVINVLEKLRERGDIEDVAYIRYFAGSEEDDISTRQLFESGSRISPDEAKTMIEGFHNGLTIGALRTLIKI